MRVNQAKARRMNLICKTRTIKIMQENVQRSKYLMRAQMLGLMFQQANRLYLIKNCFDCLKHEAAKGKVVLLNRELRSRIDPDIERTHK